MNYLLPLFFAPLLELTTFSHSRFFRFQSSGLFRGFAFVEFSDPKEAKAATNAFRPSAANQLWYVPPCGSSKLFHRIGINVNFTFLTDDIAIAVRIDFFGDQLEIVVNFKCLIATEKDVQ